MKFTHNRNLNWFTDLTGSVGQGASDLGGGVGGVLSSTLNPLGGFVNNLLGSTVETKTTSKPAEDTGSKTMTIVLVSVAVLVVIVIAFFALKSNK